MKRGAVKHPKMFRLAASLGIPHYAAVGLIESLIDFAIAYAPGGDIGRFPDDEIARGVAWERDPAELVTALTECGGPGRAGWVERHPCACRLIIHDWDEHAPDAVHMALARTGRLFANGARPSLARLSMNERKKANARLRRARVCPGHTVHTLNAPPSPLLPSPSLSSPDLHPSGACEKEALPLARTRTARNGTAYTRSGRWPDHHLAGILAAYPLRLRTGSQRALTAIDAALGRIAADPAHPGHADPMPWLLARVQAFAASNRPTLPKCWEAPAWFEQGHYDDPDESWNTGDDAHEHRDAKRQREYTEPETVPVVRIGSGTASRKAPPTASADS